MIVSGSEMQPNEVDDIGLDFSARLGSGETLVTPTVTAKNEVTGADSSAIFSAVAVIAGTKVTRRVGGVALVAGDRHIIQIRVTTSTGRALEDEHSLLVREY